MPRPKRLGFATAALLIVPLAACGDDSTTSITDTDDGSTGAPGSTSSVDPSDTANPTTGASTTTDATVTGVDASGEGDSSGEDESTGGVPMCGDGVVDVGEDCDDAGESFACNDDCTLAACGDGILNATAGEACDDAGRSGACNDDCTLAACGDGILNATAGESCDDGGESATCNVDCTTAACGDGIFNATAGEQCDDTGRSAACNPDCTNATCGDGFVNATAGEACDDAGESAACNSDCSVASCGDGVTNATAGETCDDAGESMTCNADCSAAACGDGIVNATAGEACDDAGESATCDADCTAPACGDGTVNATAGEACDDAGESAACNADCSVASCGDGIVNAAAGEACDDAGESATCNADCSVASCGDGVINAAAGETCDDGGLQVTCGLDCQPCSAEVLFQEDFSDNAAGWTLDAEWQIGTAVASPATGACGNGDPGVDHSGTADNGVAGAIIGGTVSTALHPFYYLTSPVIDTSGRTTLELSAWRWLNSDYTPYMQNHIQVYDGSAWVTVWQTEASPGVQDAAWTEVVYDLSPYANAAMQIRFGFDIDNNGVYTCSGWNLDDVTLTGDPACVDANCQSVNGLTWCYDPTTCGDACNDVCASVGMTPVADQTAWFQAQNEPAECDALAAAFGFPGTQIASFTYGCLMDSIGDHSSDLFTGDLLCSTYSGCPAEHLLGVDQPGVPCNDPGSRRSICPCE